MLTIKNQPLGIAYTLGAIQSHKKVKKGMVAGLITEAEYRVIALGVVEMIGLKALLIEFRLDGEAAMKL
jgi:hypothetical protein